MADGVAVTPSTATGRQTIDTDEVTRGGQTVQQQIVKLSLGADGDCDTLVDSGQQAAANSIPVVLASDQSAIPVSVGSIALPTGAATEATLSSIDSALAGTLTAAVSGPVSVDDGGGSVTVDGTVGVSGSVTVTDGGSTLSVDDGGGALTVDGTVTANAGAGPWPVTDNGGSLTIDGTVAVSSLPALPAGSNTIGALTANQSVNVAQMNGVTTTMGNGASGTGVQRVTIASDSTGQIVANGPVAHDGTASGNPVTIAGVASAAAPSAVSADGDVVRAWHLRNGAAATVLTAAGALIGGDASNGLDVDVTRLPALPAGTNNIGDVDVLTLPTSGTGARTQVADTTSDSVILASNSSRKGATIFNDSSAVLYLGLGSTTVTSTNYTLKIASGGYYEVPFAFTAQIRGLWATDPGDGGAKVTELT